MAQAGGAGYAERMLDTVLAITVLAALLLLLGAFLLWRRSGEAKQPLLMVLLALIALANVAIWAVPDADGTAPLDRVEQSGAER